ncbi:MAG: DUF3798 domain-containing protein [Clostridia bacterium]|nr:DUF3798 domain-containing protein [Clostridia bacterium]
MSHSIKTKSVIIRRIIAAMLAFILVFSLAACKDNGKTDADPVVPSEKKVAILVAPEAQYPEDYKAAAELAKEYPDKVIVKEYADSRILKAGNPEIMTISEELAADSEIGAIIYARATQFTTNAISAAKAKNPDIVTVCVEPEESVDKISEAANLVLCADWAKAANDIVATAKQQGAKYLVVFSINRHITDNPLIANENAALKAACEAEGITHIYENSLDPIYSTGIKGSRQYIKEAVARLYNNEKIEGADVALFSTDSSVQPALIEAANSKGLIYVCPSFPTAYNGLGEVYEATIPEKTADVESYIESIKAAATADTEGKARLSSYKFPLATKLLTSALYCAFDILNGTITSENMAEKVTARVNAVADNKKFTVGAYSETHKNVFAAYCPGFEIIK